MIITRGSGDSCGGVSLWEALFVVSQWVPPPTALVGQDLQGVGSEPALRGISLQSHRHGWFMGRSSPFQVLSPKPPTAEADVDKHRQGERNIS